MSRKRKTFLYDTATAESSDEPGRTGSKKYEIIDQVFALETTEDVLVRYMKIMCRIGNMTEMQDISNIIINTGIRCIMWFVRT